MRNKLRCARTVVAVAGAVALMLVTGVLAACGGGDDGDGGGEASASGDSQTIRVGAPAIDATSEGYYAQAKGFFEQQGLDVKLQTLSSGSAIAAAVAGDSLDVGVGSIDSIANAYQRGLPFELLAEGGLYTADEPTSLLMTAKGSPIKSAADLNGHRVAVNALNNITQVATQAWMDANGGDGDSLEFVEIPFPEMAAALSEGRVDAALMAEPAITGAKHEGAVTELGDAYTAIAPDFTISVWFANSDWVAENPDLAKRFATAIYDTAEYANKHPDKTATILAETAKLPIEVIEGMNRSHYATELDTARLQAPIDAAVDYGVIPEPVAGEEMVAAAVQETN